MVRLPSCWLYQPAHPGQLYGHLLSSPERPLSQKLCQQALAGRGRPRLDWVQVWVWAGGNSGLDGAAGSATQPGSWGLPLCRGMTSSLMLLKPGYNYLLQADTGDRVPALDPTKRLYSRASEVSGTGPPPKLHSHHSPFRKAASPRLTQCCHSFQLRSWSPRTHPNPGNAASSRFSQSLLCLCHSFGTWRGLP